MTNLNNKIDKQIFETKLKDLELMSVPNVEKLCDVLNDLPNINVTADDFHCYMQRLYNVRIKWRNQYSQAFGND